MTDSAWDAQVVELVGAACSQRDDVVDLEPNAGGAAYHATMAISFEHRRTRLLPGPTIAAASEVAPVVPLRRRRSAVHLE